MRGLMGERPLLVTMCLQHAANFHADTEIVSRSVEGPIHRYTYADADRRARRLAKALLRLGVQPGDRVGTLAWNTWRHFELYYAISGIGAVCHTVNPRLFDEQIVYIVNHAQDRLLFVETSFIPLIERLLPRLPKDCQIVLLGEAETSLPMVGVYDELTGAETDDFAWPEFNEYSASALCYTSGTTGNPKGVLYSHRSTVLHAMGASMPSGITLTATDVVCPVVPLFHACGWGTAYIAPMNGAKLVYPGPKLDGESLHELFESEGVTVALGVPTVWLGMDTYLREKNQSCSTLRWMLCGGSAVPAALLQAFEARGIDILQGWGMTEMSPLGTTAALKRKHLPLAPATQTAIKLKQGRPVFGVEMKIVDDAGNILPHDGKAIGELLVRGPWIANGYFDDEAATAAAVEPDGWFHTGDVASIDPDGYVQLTDRHKDVIKSGGEWISSIDLENAAMADETVAEAAAIAIPHPKWSERPLLVVVPRAGCRPERDKLIALLAQHFPKWMLPDDVVVVDELPHTATGKIMKSKLREMFADYKPPATEPAPHPNPLPVNGARERVRGNPPRPASGEREGPIAKQWEGEGQPLAYCEPNDDIGPMTVTVRFAPSPTGFLHIGGARTALFNWLFARHHGGAFRLRIEDTDRARSTPEATAAIIDGLKWLGVDWDGEVVFQFARAAHHAEIAQHLLDAGHAYRCYCTPDELEAMRAKALAEKRSVRYDGTWRDRDPSEAPPGVAPAIRLKAEQTGATIIRDHVLGEVTVDNQELDDLIILRSDGTPTYNFSVVVDDHDMGITHVIRGNEHFRNAFRQTQIYRALGWVQPEWAHIPLIHGPDGAKMSKRHGALGIDEYRKLGYLPEAIRNYLLRLGWSHGDDEIISTEQAIGWFDLAGIHKSPAQFDFAKLDSVNAHYIREADDARLVGLVVELLEAELGHPLSATDRDRLTRAMPALKPRAKTTVELAEKARFYVAPRPIRPAADAAKLLTADARSLLGTLSGEIGDTEWQVAALEARLRDFVTAKGVKLGAVAQPLRVALTGSLASPGIFEVMEVLGRDETLGRLADAVESR